MAETFAEVPTARPPHMCSAFWPTCSTVLSCVQAVPKSVGSGTGCRPVEQLCFPTTCCPESMSR